MSSSEEYSQNLLYNASEVILPLEIEQYKLEYFAQLVANKLVQNRKDWTKLDQGLLPALDERLKCFVKPI